MALVPGREQRRVLSNLGVSFLRRLHQAIRDRALSDDDARIPDALIVDGLWSEDDLPPADALVADVAFLVGVLRDPSQPLREQKAAACALATVAPNLHDELRCEVREALLALFADRAGPDALRLSGIGSAKDLPPGPEHVETVSAVFADRGESVRVRERAAWILSAVSDLPEAASLLLIASYRDRAEPFELRKTLSHTLARLRRPRAYDALLDAVEGRDEVLFVPALHAFSLVSCVRDGGDVVRASTARRALAERAEEAPAIRIAAAHALARVVDAEGSARALLVRLLADASAPELLRVAAASGLQNHLGDEHLELERLAELALSHEASTPLREQCVDTLRAFTAGAVPFPEQVAVLTPPRDPQQLERWFGRAFDVALPCLQRLIEGADEPRSLRAVATAALGRMGSSPRALRALVATVLNGSLPDELRGSAAHALSRAPAAVWSEERQAIEEACEAIDGRNPERSYPARQARSMLDALGRAITR